MDPIAVGSWLWENIGEQVKDWGITTTKKYFSKRSWPEREAAYKKRLVELYSKTKLLGNPKEINLDKIYTDVYVLDQLSAFRRLVIDKKTNSLQENSALSATRTLLLDHVQKKRRIYLLGKPGSGKSTFLKMVCLQCCLGEIKKTPILIPLKQWNDSGLELIEFISREFDICRFPNASLFVEQLLATGSAILLFDGLDEVPVENDTRTKTIAILSDFSRKYASTQIILTCRIAATEYSFDQFNYYEIADFTQTQQNEFIKNWYGEEEIILKSFKKQWALPENQGLRNLAQTPLLLALLCLAFDETMAFPKRRIELYQEATNALLRKWDSSRGIRRDSLYKSLSHIRKEQLLSKLAANTFFEGLVFFEKKLATKTIDAYIKKLPPRDEAEDSDSEDILRAMEAQHGLLIERAMGIYSFSHLTIQEYFTAQYLVENAHTGEIQEKIKSHLSEDRWREVFLLAASSLDDASLFFDAIKDLFVNKFFSDKSIVDLFRLSQSTNLKVAYAEKHGKFNEKTYNRPNTKDHHDFAKILDLTLVLASNFYYIRCAEKAAWRVRRLINYLESIEPTTKSLITLKQDSIEKFINYLQATIVLVESLQLASIDNRDLIIDTLICPVTY